MRLLPFSMANDGADSLSLRWPAREALSADDRARVRRYAVGWYSLRWERDEELGLAIAAFLPRVDRPELRVGDLEEDLAAALACVRGASATSPGGAPWWSDPALAEMRGAWSEWLGAWVPHLTAALRTRGGQRGAGRKTIARAEILVAEARRQLDGEQSEVGAAFLRCIGPATLPRGAAAATMEALFENREELRARYGSLAADASLDKLGVRRIDGVLGRLHRAVLRGPLKDERQGSELSQLRSSWARWLGGLLLASGLSAPRSGWANQWSRHPRSKWTRAVVGSASVITLVLVWYLNLRSEPVEPTESTTAVVGSTLEAPEGQATATTGPDSAGILDGDGEAAREAPPTCLKDEDHDGLCDEVTDPDPTTIQEWYLVDNWIGIRTNGVIARRDFVPGTWVPGQSYPVIPGVASARATRAGISSNCSNHLGEETKNVVGACIVPASSLAAADVPLPMECVDQDLDGLCGFGGVDRDRGLPNAWFYVDPDRGDVNSASAEPPLPGPLEFIAAEPTPFGPPAVPGVRPERAWYRQVYATCSGRTPESVGICVSMSGQPGPLGQNIRPGMGWPK